MLIARLFVEADRLPLFTQSRPNPEVAGIPLANYARFVRKVHA